MQRKLQFVRNALKRYYNIWNFPMKLDAETAMMSTEIGILHYFIDRVLVQDKCLDAEARIVDCMAGAGTISLCLALHLPRAELHALEIDAARVVLLEHNLMQAGKAVGKAEAEPVHESGKSVGNSDSELNLMQAASKDAKNAEAEHESNKDSNAEHNNAENKDINNANSPHATDDASREPGPLTPPRPGSVPRRIARHAHRALGRLFYVFYRQADRLGRRADFCAVVVRAGAAVAPRYLGLSRRARRAARARIVIKVAPGTEMRPSASPSARAPRSTRSTFTTGMRLTLVLDMRAEPASLTANFESVQHRVRGATAVPLQLRRTTARPRCGMYTPPPAQRRQSSAPDVAQVHCLAFSLVSVLLDANMRIDSH